MRIMANGVARDATPNEAAGLVAEAGPAAPRTLTPREFRARFTPEEKGVLTLAARAAEDAGDPTLRMFLDELSAAQAVELDHPDTLAGMTVLVATGLLTQARATAILAG